MTPIQLPTNPTITDLLLALTRLEGKVDQFVDQSNDHEVRIRALERARWPIPSVAILLSLAAGGISAASLAMR